MIGSGRGVVATPEETDRLIHEERGVWDIWDSTVGDNMNKSHQATIGFHRSAVVDFSRGFQSTECDNTIHPVASATIETHAAMVQPSLTRRRILSRPDRALKRTAKVITPLRGKEVVA